MTLQEKLDHLPDRPGVYLHKDAKGQVIYIGKAASLRSRVRSYFQESRARDPKTDARVQQIRDVDYIVTDNELEALILESNLVKKHRPRHHVPADTSAFSVSVEVNVTGIMASPAPEKGATPGMGRRMTRSMGTPSVVSRDSPPSCHRAEATMIRSYAVGLPPR